MKAFSVNITSDSKIPDAIGFGVTNKEIYRIIENKIALHYSLLPAQFLNTSRKMGVCEARQLFQYFMRKHTTYSWGEIGYYAGKLDHSDVVYNAKKISTLCEVYPMFKYVVENLNDQIKAEISELIKVNLAV